MKKKITWIKHQNSRPPGLVDLGGAVRRCSLLLTVGSPVRTSSVQPIRSASVWSREKGNQTKRRHQTDGPSRSKRLALPYRHVGLRMTLDGCKWTGAQCVAPVVSYELGSPSVIHALRSLGGRDLSSEVRCAPNRASHLYECRARRRRTDSRCLQTGADANVVERLTRERASDHVTPTVSYNRRTFYVGFFFVMFDEPLGT